MNLWVRKIKFINFCLIGLLLSACESEESTINLGIKNESLELNYQEFSLADHVSQVWLGGTYPSFSGSLLSGANNFVNFGQVSSTAFCDFTLGSIPLDLEKISQSNIVDLDFTFRIKDASGSFSKLDKQIFYLYQLKDSISITETTTTATKLPYEKLIGELEFYLHPDSIGLISEEAQDSDKYDRANEYIYQINFNLTQEFKFQFFDMYKKSIASSLEDVKVDSTQVDGVWKYTYQKGLNRNTFNKTLDGILKGIAIVPDQNNTAIIRFDVTEIYSNILLKYQIDQMDRSVVFACNSLKSFSNIEPNQNVKWNGGVFDGKDINHKSFDTDDGLIYFQSGTNMFFQIDLSFLKDFLKTEQNISIQRAILSFNNPYGAQGEIGQPSYFNLYILDNESKESDIDWNALDQKITQFLPIGSPSVIDRTLFSRDTVSNSISSSYYIHLPNYIQILISNESQNDRLIGMIDPAFSDQGILSFSVKKEDIKLELYYTIF